MEDNSKQTFNVDEKINLLFNFTNKKIDDDCFKINKIDLKNITIDDIKIKEDNKEILNYLMEGNLQLREKYDTTLILKRFSDYHAFDFIINPYKKSEKVNNLLSNRDSLFSYILSSLVLDGKTESILLPIVNIDYKLEDLSELLSSLDMSEFYRSKVNSEEISDTFSINLKENFYRGINLEKYLKEADKDDINYKQILFQIIHTLAVIQKEYPTFVHNNLLLRNILVYPISQEVKLMFDRDLYVMDNVSSLVKIFNFSKSEMKDFKPDNGVSNKYTDLFDFLRDLHRITNFKEFDKETVEFLDKIYPKNIRGKKLSKELFEPKNLLDDKYFKSLKNFNEKITSKPDYMKNHSEKNSKVFMTSLDSETRSILGDQDDYQKIKRIEKKGSKKLNRKLKINQEGGFRQSKSHFSSAKNTPFVTNDAKETYNKRRNEQPPVKEPPVIAEQKLYDVKSGKSETVLPQVYPPGFVPVPNPYYPAMNPQYAYGYKPNQIPVQKYYNITLSNPVGNHSTVNDIYEDMIPGDKQDFTLTSIFERTQLTNFIRSMILEKGDGEDITISPGPNKTLLSYLRLLELNPYSIGKNPYKSLSRGFLLYNSAYPIRYKQDNNSIEVAKHSTGMNVRIYQLSDGAILADRLAKNIDFDEFEVWREIKYYQYVREQILKTKVSPNFVGIYLYTMDKHSGIDYNKLDMLISKDKPKDILLDEIKNDKKVNDQYSVNPLELLTMANVKNPIPIKDGSADLSLTITKEDKRNIAKFLVNNNFLNSEGSSSNEYKWTEAGIKYLRDNNFLSYLNNFRPVIGKLISLGEIEVITKLVGKPDLTKGSSYSLVALTEAPNKNIIQWASPLVEKFGAVKKMIETGYHTPNVWRSILFQLVYSCAVLQKSEILFTNFSLENNFFIKDLYVEDGKRGHWLYMVGDYEFFIPNYGYLLMIDSRFVDISSSSNSSRKFKINSSKIYQKNEPDLDYNLLSYKNFKEIINPDNFRTNLEKLGGEMPDKEIQDLLLGIYKDEEEDISRLLIKYFPNFLNNRVGTLLTMDEINSLPMINNYNFKIGDLVAWEESYNQYKWVVIVDLVEGENSVTVQASDKAIQNKVSKFSLNKYPESETVRQKVIDGISLDPTFTIETYNLKNLI